MKYVCGVLAIMIFVAPVYAFEDAPQTFTLDGRLFSDATGTTPLNDTNVTLVFQILTSDESCILYEETRSGFNSSASNGYFSLQIGSEVGAVKRSAGDSGNSMASVYSNTMTIVPGKKVSDGTACSATPQAGDQRFVRIQVTPSSGGTRTLTPNMALDSVPHAIIAERAESLRGLDPSQLLQVNTTAGQALSQSNVENIFTTSNYNLLLSLLNGTSTLYTKPAANGTIAIPNLTSTPPATPAAGQIWYDAGVIKYYDGVSSSIKTISTGTSTQVSAAAGSASTPSISFAGDPDTGWYAPLANTLAAATGGTERVRIDSSGNVGVGAVDPTFGTAYGANETVVGVTGKNDSTNSIGRFVLANNRPTATNLDYTGFIDFVSVNNPGSERRSAGIGSMLSGAGGVNGYGGDLRFYTKQDNSTYTEKMIITPEGRLGIGTTAPAQTLDVNGSIRVQGTAFTNAVSRGSSAGLLQLFTDAAAGSGAEINLFGSTHGTPGILAFKTGTTTNAERMRIDASGNVGIGTTAPGRLLHVNGPMRVQPAALPGTPATGDIAVDSGDSNKLKYYNGSAWLDLGAGSGGSFTNVSNISNAAGDITLAPQVTTGKVAVTSGTSSTSSTTGALVVTGGLGVSENVNVAGNVNANNLQANTKITTPQIYGSTVASGTLKLDGTSNVVTGDVLINSAGGNVGIGTTAPTSILHIKQANTTSGLTLEDASTVGTGSVYYTSGADLKLVRANSSIELNSANGLKFITGGSSERMRIDASGNVGIGTASPNGRLHVFGSSDINQLAVQANSTQTSNLVVFQNSSGSVLSGITGSGRFSAPVGSVGNPSFTFNGSVSTGFYLPATDAIGASIAGSEKMRIDSSGNVGIGTTAPVDPLSFGAPAASATKATINLSNTALSGANASGTYIGANPASAGPDFMNFQVGGTSYFKVDSGGNITSVNGYVAGNSISTNAWKGDVYTPTSAAVAVPPATGGGPTLGALNLATTNGAGAYVNLAAKNAGGTSQYMYMGAISNAAGNTPSFVLGQQTGATAYTERIRIDASGNVGIGTAAPATKLDVSGSIRVGNGNETCGATYAGAMKYTAGQIYICDGAAWYSLMQSGYNGLFANGTAALPSVAFNTDSSTGLWSPAYGSLGVSSNGVERIRVLSNGNVGIGTTAPYSKLSNTSTNIVDATALNGISTDSLGWATNAAGYAAAISNTSNGANSHGLLVKTAGTASTARALEVDSGSGAKFIVQADGNVGIGTTAPTGLLNLNTTGATTNSFVQSSVTGTNELKQVTNGGVNAIQQFKSRAGYTSVVGGDQLGGWQYYGADATATPVMRQAGEIMVYADGTVTAGAVPGSMTFNTASSAGTLLERMRINSSGNVGIGTSVPASALHVSIPSGGPVATFTNNGVGAFVPGFNTYAPNLAAGQAVYNNTGVAASTNNAAGFNFHFAGSGSASNRADINFYGGSPLLSVRADGNVGIGTTAPARALHVAGPIRIDATALPGTPVIGDIAIDSGDGNKFKYYNGSAWIALMSGGSGSFTSVTSISNSAGNITLSPVATSGAVVIDSGTSSFSTGSGALRVTGGVGITENLNVGGNMQLTGAVDIGNTATIHSQSATVYTATSSIINAPAGVGVATANDINSDGTFAGYQASARNSANTYQSGYVGLVSNSTGYTPTMVFGRQTGATAYTESMRIDTNGNVGIGTTAPTSKLQVAGDASFLNSSVQTGVGSAGYTAVQLGTGGVGNGLFAPTANMTAIATNSIERLRVDSAGNVGIGTTAPSTNLEVSSTSAGPIRITSTSTSATGILLANSKVWSVNSAGSAGTLAPDGSFLVRNATDNINAFTILSSGNVGIGTTAPSSRFHVAGPNSGGYPMTIQAAPGTGPAGYMNLAMNNTTSGAYKSNIDFQNSGATKFSLGVDYLGNGTNNFALFDNVAGTHRFWVEPNGNVGIGTTAPGYKLDVNGTVNATALKINGVDVGAGAGDFMKDGSVAMTGPLKAANGSAAAPAYSFASEQNTGWFFAGTGITALAVAGSEKLRVDNSGNVMIGKTSAGAKLDVNGDIKSTGNIRTVAGQIYSASKDNGSLTASGGNIDIDWNNGNIQRVLLAGSGTCNDATYFNFANMQDGGAYTLIVDDTNATASGRCLFKNSTDTVLINPTNVQPSSANPAVYTLIKIGTKIYISWVNGTSWSAQ